MLKILMRIPRKISRIKIPQALRPDMRDIFFFAGLSGIWYGLWGYDPRLSFLVVGALLFGIAVIGQLLVKK